MGTEIGQFGVSWCWTLRHGDFGERRALVIGPGRSRSRAWGVGLVEWAKHGHRGGDEDCPVQDIMCWRRSKRTRNRVCWLGEFFLMTFAFFIKRLRQLSDHKLIEIERTKRRSPRLILKCSSEETFLVFTCSIQMQNDSTWKKIERHDHLGILGLWNSALWNFFPSQFHNSTIPYCNNSTACLPGWCATQNIFVVI